MIILCYHELAKPETNPWVLSPDRFREQMAVLRDRGYRNALFENVLDRFDAACSREIVITFDDGRLGCLEHAADILASYGWRAVFYVCTEFAGAGEIPPHETYSSLLNWSQIRRLHDEGHVIGSHGRSHRSFKGLDARARSHELTVSKSQIEDEVGTSCIHFAAPYGYLDATTSTMAREAGYKTAVSTIFGVNKRPAAAHAMRRYEVHSTQSTECFIAQLRALEAMQAQFSVLVIDAEFERSKMSDQFLKRAAGYDVVVTVDDVLQQSLSTYNIRALALSRCDIDALSCITSPPIPAEETPTEVPAIRRLIPTGYSLLVHRVDAGGHWVLH